MAASRSLLARMVRAAKLEVDLYEEVEANSGATLQALAVVVIASLASGIGAAINSIIDGAGLLRVLWGLLTGIIGLIIAWALWSLITWIIGSTIFKGRKTSATWGELLRTIGFAFSPSVLLLLVFIPIFGWVVSLVALLWTVVAVVIAVRQALDFTTWRAVFTCLLGAIVYLVIIVLINALPSLIGGGRMLY